MLSPCRIFGICLALIAGQFIAVPASAQGTFGALPDPISSRELDRFAERLALSDEQRLALAERHAEYLEQFLALRDREIEQLLQQVRDLQRNFDLGERRRVEQAVRDINRVMSRIRALDEQLFDELLPILTEQQSVMLPRIRQLRERSRFSSEITRYVDFLNPASRIDLSEMIQSLDLSPDVMEQVDPLLVQYEQRLTGASRRIFEATSSMVLEALKRLEAMGFTSGDVRDPMVALPLVQAFQEIWSELTADVLKQATETASLQRRTYRSLAALMPAEDARRLREAFYRRAYPEAAAIGRGAQRQLRTAMGLEELPDDQREAIEAIASSHEATRDRLADQIIDLLEERRANLSLRDVVRRGRGRSADEIQSKIDDLRSRADEADAAAIRSLHSAVGPELAERIGELRPERRRELVRVFGGPGGIELRQSVDGPGMGRRGERWQRPAGAGPVRGAGQARRDAGLPQRINITDLHEWAHRLNLDDGQWSVLADLYESYMDGYADVNERYIEPYREAMDQGFSGGMAEAGSAWRRMAELRPAAFEGLRRIEQSFLDDVQVAVIHPQQTAEMARIRRERERHAYISAIRASGRVFFGGAAGGPSGGAMMAGGPSGAGGSGGPGLVTNESGVDLTRILAEIELSAQERAAVAVSLDAYDAQATDLFRQRYEVEMDMREQMANLRGAWGDGENADGGAGNRLREMRRAMQAMTARQREAAQRIADLNRHTLAQMTEGLSPAGAAALRHGFERQAYPDVFNDPATAEPLLAAALEVPDLSDRQRTRLLELAAEYRGRYARLSQQMIEQYTAQSAAAAEGEGGGRPPGRPPGSAIERLRFERREASEHTVRQLRSLLTVDQLSLLDESR